MNISLYNLSKAQTTVLKGISMIIIVLHNFIHATNVIGENEFDFNPDRIIRFLVAIKHNAFMLINGSLSYLGIFALEIFIFASAYGLVKQFLKNKPSSYWKYLLPKIIKIYGLIICGLICYALFLFPIGETNFDAFMNIAQSVLLLYNNFSSNTLFSVPHAGPWWYFSFIVQLYILFPLLFFFLDKYKKRGFLCMLIFSYVLIYVLSPIAEQHNFPIYANFIGHLPEFIIGMGFAFFKEFRINYKIIVPILILFILSNFFEFAFPFSFACATVLLFYFLYPIYNKTDISKPVYKALFFVGNISMFMFILNALFRAYLGDYAFGKDQYIIFLWALIHLSCTMFVSYIVSIIYNKTFTKPLNKLIKFVSS